MTHFGTIDFSNQEAYDNLNINRLFFFTVCRDILSACRLPVVCDRAGEARRFERHVAEVTNGKSKDRWNLQFRSNTACSGKFYE